MANAVSHRAQLEQLRDQLREERRKTDPAASHWSSGTRHPRRNRSRRKGCALRSTRNKEEK